MQVTYEFYQTVYGGTALTEEAFGTFALRAAEELACFQRIYIVTASPEGEARAVCAMAEVLAERTEKVTSASIGSVSVRYESGEDRTAKGLRQALLGCVRRYMEVCRGVSGC